VTIYQNANVSDQSLHSLQKKTENDVKDFTAQDYTINLSRSFYHNWHKSE